MPRGVKTLTVSKESTCMKDMNLKDTFKIVQNRSDSRRAYHESGRRRIFSVPTRLDALNQISTPVSSIQFTKKDPQSKKL